MFYFERFIYLRIAGIFYTVFAVSIVWILLI